MKAHFSKKQRTYLTLGILTFVILLPIVICTAIVLYSMGDRTSFIVLIAFYLGMLAISSVLIFLFRFLYCTIVANENGISIQTKKGKVFSFLPWDKISYFSVTKGTMAGERYLTLSTKKDLPLLRSTFGGVYFTMYYERKTTIVFPTSDEMLNYCKEKLEKLGITVTEVVNPNTSR